MTTRDWVSSTFGEHLNTSGHITLSTESKTKKSQVKAIDEEMATNIVGTLESVGDQVEVTKSIKGVHQEDNDACNDPKGDEVNMDSRLRDIEDNTALIMHEDQKKELELLNDLANASYQEPLNVVASTEGRYPPDISDLQLEVIPSISSMVPTNPVGHRSVPLQSLHSIVSHQGVLETSAATVEPVNI